MGEKRRRATDPEDAGEDSHAPDADGGETHDRDTNRDTTPEIPEAVVDEAERLTRLAADAAVEEAAEAYRESRDRAVREHDFTARVRDEDDTLVLYPEEWVDDGVVRVDRIEDTDRAVEVSLSGPDHGATWEAVEAANQRIVEAITQKHCPDHAANVRAFADFMGNHYLKRVDDATDAEREEFLTEYYPRNAWPSAEQASVVEQSLSLVDGVSDEI
jgi:hypothetical protein